MKQHKLAKVYLFRLTVKGSGEFPFDMLRYDGCFPEAERESGKLYYHASFEHPREIELHMVSFNDKGPTKGRWQSFGWNVVKTEQLNENGQGTGIYI